VVARTSCLFATGCTEKELEDGYGHGTHVAGIVGALDNNFGVVGTAPGARIWSVKAGNQNGEFAMSDVLEAINWVTARSSQIEAANMSLGCAESFDCKAAALQEAITASVNKGVVYVVSAGNENQNVSPEQILSPPDLNGVRTNFGSFGYVPARFSNVITVSAIADFDGLPGGAAASPPALTWATSTPSTGISASSQTRTIPSLISAIGEPRLI